MSPTKLGKRETETKCEEVSRDYVRRSVMHQIKDRGKKKDILRYPDIHFTRLEPARDLVRNNALLFRLNTDKRFL